MSTDIRGIRFQNSYSFLMAELDHVNACIRQAGVTYTPADMSFGSKVVEKMSKKALPVKVTIADIDKEIFLDFSLNTHSVLTQDQLGSEKKKLAEFLSEPKGEVGTVLRIPLWKIVLLDPQDLDDRYFCSGFDMPDTLVIGSEEDGVILHLHKDKVNNGYGRRFRDLRNDLWDNHRSEVRKSIIRELMSR